jgi:hypothetical protein
VEAKKTRLKIAADRANIVLGRVPIPADLRFLPLYVTPDAKGALHESLKRACMVVAGVLSAQRSLKCLTGYCPRSRWYRQIPEGSFIHQSVLDGGYAVSQLPNSTPLSMEFGQERMCANRDPSV